MLLEPGRDGGGGDEEDGAGTQRAADALGQDELIVFGGYAGHHQAEHMQDTTEEQRPPGPIAVEEPAKDGTLWACD